MNILAIDLGGSSAKIGLVKNEEITKRWKIPTDKNNLWGNIKDNLTDLDLNEIDVIGLSMPGFIDHEKGIVTLSGNLNLHNYDVKKEFLKYFNKPVYVVNDANAAALGEYWVGAGKDFKSIILYTIGTGVGGGLVVDGKLVYGHSGYAGEFGHGGNFQNKYPCSCGLKHCIEPVSSATGITKLLAENGHDLSVKEAGEYLVLGDKKIEAVFKEALTPLAHHICVMETAINPEAIIIGGGPSEIGEPFRLIIDHLVRDNQLPFVYESAKILLASTKNDAGILGAAYWAMSQHKK